MAPEFGTRGGRAERERLILAIAERQHGVVTVEQLRSVGLSERGGRSRSERGRLHRVHQGVYAVGRRDLPLHGRWMAAVLACGPGAVLSHGSAARLHGLVKGDQARTEVTVSRQVGLARAGIRVSRSARLPPADRAVVDRIPCTSVARTLLDLAGRAPHRVVERACDQAEVLRVFDLAAMRELLARSRGRRGIRQLRLILGITDLGENVPRNELEARFVRLCRRAGVPPPAVNSWITLAGEEMEVDFLWQAERVAIETDGYETHRTRQAFKRDRRRDQIFELEGWRHVRITWDEVTHDPAHVVRILRLLFAVGPPPTPSVEKRRT